MFFGCDFLKRRQPARHLGEAYIHLSQVFDLFTRLHLIKSMWCGLRSINGGDNYANDDGTSMPSPDVEPGCVPHSNGNLALLTRLLMIVHSSP